MQPPPSTGSRVRIRQRAWLVERTAVDGRVVRLDVRHRREHLTFLAPFDRVVPLEGRRRTKHVSAQGARARLFGTLATTRGWREPLPSTVDGLEILGYQLEPWLAFAEGVRRVLLADAVGLGKTIQAGIVLAELHRRLGGVQALIVTPSALRDQWAAELETRFGLRCAMADRPSLARAARELRYGETPWLGPAIRIASYDFLKQPQVRDGMPLEAWDLLVIDEAHDVTGSSERHAACDELARRARRVLLLSATPHPGDEARFSRLLALGALPGDRNRPVVFRRTRGDTGLSGIRTVRWRAIAPAGAELRLFEALRTYERRVLGRSRAGSRQAALLLLSVFRKRALSTTAALDRSLTRRLEWLAADGGAHVPDWAQPDLWGNDEDESARSSAGHSPPTPEFLARRSGDGCATSSGSPPTHAGASRGSGTSCV